MTCDVLHKKMNLVPLVKRSIIGKAIADIVFAALFGTIGCLCLWIMFLIGMWVGPLILWFWEPIPVYVPALSGVILLAVSIVSAVRADPKYWTNLTYDSKSLGEIPLSEAPARLRRSGASLPADMQILGPASVHMITRLLSIPLLIGPTLAMSAIRSLKEAYRLLTADTKHLASLLVYVYSNGGRVSFAELSQAVTSFEPDGDGKMLLLLDGVILVRKEMQGIALADRLEERIKQIAEK